MSTTKCHRRARQTLFATVLLPTILHAEAAPFAANDAFEGYAATIEATLRQHPTPTLPEPGSPTRLQRGDILLDRIPIPSNAAPGALLHHWRAVAFAPGATAYDFERLMHDFKAWPQHFAPDVVGAGAITSTRDHALMHMRVRQHHVITVVLDATYDVAFTDIDTHHGYTTSRSTRIDEIASPGSPGEHALAPEEAHGFLWRQNTYWRFEERDGGLLLQVESLSLTRPIPRGLGWAVGPYVDSIPRESLEFTLRSARAAIEKHFPPSKGTP